MVHKDGEKMSKSLGNLVFVDQLRETWDPRAIRLGDHRAPLPHRVGVGRRADAAQRAPGSTRWNERAGGRTRDLLDEVRGRLDDDLDTPGALAAIDAARRRGGAAACSREAAAPARRRPR